jgi:hypothetical protein
MDKMNSNELGSFSYTGTRSIDVVLMEAMGRSGDVWNIS